MKQNSQQQLFVIESKISDLIANKLICSSRLSLIVVRS